MKTNVHLYAAIKSIFFCCLVISILFLYWPGLTGGFMLDDLSSLPSLFQTIDTCGYECAVFSGSTGPTGRPISLLSFAMQQNHWPNPYYFKLVNLSIHLLNFILVTMILSQVLKLLSFRFHLFYISLLAAFIWAIWPLQLSSVLYVVQRMVLLSSFFVLCGVAFYLYMRPRLNDVWEGQNRKWGILILGLASCGLVAIFSKESGVLLLVYVLVLEFILFNNINKSGVVSFFRMYCLMFPFILLLMYLIYKVGRNPEMVYLSREFSLSERVLTQGRILVDYIQSLYLPRPSDLGLYHDAYLKSENFWTPLSTLFSWLAILVIALLAFMLRKRYKLFSLAIFWYLGGHILESTVLPLELYFEHRNYLPVMMITLASVVALFSIIRKASSALVKGVFISFFLVYISVIVGVTFTQATLWGKPYEYGLVQANEHPESIRARSLLVDVYSQLGMVDRAYEEVIKMKSDFPTVAGVIVSDLEFACYDPKYPLESLETLIPKLRQAKFGYGVIVSVANTLSEIDEEKCDAVQTDYILKIIQVLKEHPQYAKKTHLLEGFEIIALKILGRLDEVAEIYANRDLLPEDWPRYISVLATLGRFKEALAIADLGLNELNNQPLAQAYFNDIGRLRAVLVEDIKLLNQQNK